MEREQITINGMEFRAERLMPNYQGKYDCICENCIFNADWVDFGEDFPCMKVKCMINDGRNGNRNVWTAVGDRDLLKRKPRTQIPVPRGGYREEGYGIRQGRSRLRQRRYPQHQD